MNCIQENPIISGVTLHSFFFKIPTSKKGQEMKQPEGSLGENVDIQMSVISNNIYRCNPISQSLHINLLFI
jgi:hypothetical protein